MAHLPLMAGGPCESVEGKGKGKRKEIGGGIGRGSLLPFTRA
jgi:hypothetical protein